LVPLVVGRVGDFYPRELQRMPPMDIADAPMRRCADVADDRFLADGHPVPLIPEVAGQG